MATKVDRDAGGAYFYMMDMMQKIKDNTQNKILEIAKITGDIGESFS